eukprot:scaffold159355_cov16-Prasinocladus_malaysianus.AAC.2
MSLGLGLVSTANDYVIECRPPGSERTMHLPMLDYHRPPSLSVYSLMSFDYEDEYGPCLANDQDDMVSTVAVPVGRALFCGSPPDGTGPTDPVSVVKCRPPNDILRSDMRHSDPNNAQEDSAILFAPTDQSHGSAVYSYIPCRRPTIRSSPSGGRRPLR